MAQQQKEAPSCLILAGALNIKSLPKPGSKDFSAAVSRDLSLLSTLNKEFRELAESRDAAQVAEQVSASLPSVLELVFTRRTSKPKLDGEADALLKLLSESLPANVFLDLFLQQAQRQKDASIRRQIFKANILYIKSLVRSKTQSAQAQFGSSILNVILAGLTDVWSNIRKDTARSLFVKGESFLDPDGVKSIYTALVNIVSRSDSDSKWQSVDGALHGIHAIVVDELRQQADLQGTTTGYSPPHYLWETIQHDVCIPMFGHSQGDIRSNAGKIFLSFLGFRRAQEERTGILDSLLAQLKPRADNMLLPDFTAESTLHAVASVVEKCDFQVASSLFANVVESIQPYTRHQSSIVRQAVADIFRSFADVDSNNDSTVGSSEAADGDSSKSSRLLLVEMVCAHCLIRWHANLVSMKWVEKESLLLAFEAVTEHLLSAQIPAAAIEDVHWPLSDSNTVDATALDIAQHWYSSSSISFSNTAPAQVTVNFPENQWTRVFTLMAFALHSCATQCADDIYEVRRIATQVVTRTAHFFTNAGHHSARVGFLFGALRRLTAAVVLSDMSQAHALMVCLDTWFGTIEDGHHSTFAVPVLEALRALISFAESTQTAAQDVDIRVGIATLFGKVVHHCSPQILSEPIGVEAMAVCRDALLQFVSADREMAPTFSNRKLQGPFFKQILAALATFATHEDVAILERLLQSPHFVAKGHEGSQTRHSVLRAALHVCTGAHESRKAETVPHEEGSGTPTLPAPTNVVGPEAAVHLAAGIPSLVMAVARTLTEVSLVKEDSVAVSLIFDVFKAAAKAFRSSAKADAATSAEGESAIAQALNQAALFFAGLPQDSAANDGAEGSDEDDSDSDWDESSSEEVASDDGQRRRAVLSFVVELKRGVRCVIDLQAFSSAFVPLLMCRRCTVGQDTDWLSSRILPILADQDRPALLPLLVAAKDAETEL